MVVARYDLARVSGDHEVCQGFLGQSSTHHRLELIVEGRWRLGDRKYLRWNCLLNNSREGAKVYKLESEGV